MNQELINQIKALTVEDIILECACEDLASYGEIWHEGKFYNGIWYGRLAFMKQSLRAIRKRHSHSFQMQKINDMRKSLIGETIKDFDLSRIVHFHQIRPIISNKRSKNGNMSSKSKRV